MGASYLCFHIQLYYHFQVWSLMLNAIYLLTFAFYPQFSKKCIPPPYRNQKPEKPQRKKKKSCSRRRGMWHSALESTKFAMTYSLNSPQGTQQNKTWNCHLSVLDHSPCLWVSCKSPKHALSLR